MVPLSALWLPILLSGVAAFVISNLVHMVLGYHKHDYGSVPKEDAVMDALRPFQIPPGDYMMPRAKDMADMKSTDFKEKVGSSRVDLQACKLEYSIVSPK